MVDAMIAFVTCGSAEEARRIATALVEKNLAACVNIVPGVESCYRWKGEVEWSQESLLVIKTTGDAIAPAHEAVMEGHSYENPEFVAFTIDEGSASYLRWIQESVDADAGGPPASEWDE